MLSPQGMRVELWADPYGINLKCYWECLEENLGNLGNDLETPKEHFEKKEKKPKKIHYPPLPPLPDKKWTPHECMLSLLIGCMKLLFPKLSITIFGLCYWHGHKLRDYLCKLWTVFFFFLICQMKGRFPMGLQHDI